MTTKIIQNVLWNITRLAWNRTSMLKQRNHISNLKLVNIVIRPKIFPFFSLLFLFLNFPSFFVTFRAHTKRTFTDLTYDGEQKTLRISKDRWRITSLFVFFIAWLGFPFSSSYLLPSCFLRHRNNNNNRSKKKRISDPNTTTFTIYEDELGRWCVRIYVQGWNERKNE